MKYRPTLLLLLFLPLVAWGLIATAPATSQPSLATLAPASPAFLQQAGSQAAAVLPPSTGPAPVGVIGTSAIPPGPQLGENCSVRDPAGGTCSAQAQRSRCSALNGNGNICSAFDLNGPTSNTCSAFAANSVCSVLPPLNPDGPSSFCSATPAQGTPLQQCSSVGLGNRQQCSAKGFGGSFCSSAGFQTPDYFCSVLNEGARQRSFCSTKFNQPTLSKGCSIFPQGGAPDQCSVISGGSGVCTTFGQADPNSCSSFGTTGHCSVIFGPPGNQCAQ